MTDQVAETVTPFTQEPAPVAQDPVAAVAQPAPVTPVTPVSAFKVPDVAQELIGEGRKYASAEDALAALPHAQSHISKLEEEMASLREDLSKRKTAEEILDAINKKSPEEATVPQFDPSQLDALIENKLSAKEQYAKDTANTTSVANKFRAEFGDENAEKVYIQKASELGLSVDYMNSLAKTSPEAVFKLCGLKPTTSTPTRITSSVNSEALQNQAPAIVKPKSVMGGSTAKDDIAAWRAAGAPTE